MSWRTVLVCLALCLGGSANGRAQTVAYRGFIEGSALGFAERAPNDPTRAVADLLVRNEIFVKPAGWLQLSGGFDVRANSHDQVENGWRVDFSDRQIRRPQLSVRRLAASLTHGPITVDVGKQFIRWGKTDIVNPTDRFAPRDYMNVVDNEFLAVAGIRAGAQLGAHTFEAVWVPRLTPSRTPLLDQRWAVLPPGVTTSIVEAEASIPKGSQIGIRWGHMTGPFEYSVSFYDGFNHQPDFRINGISLSAAQPAIEVARVYQPIRTYGGDLAVPVRWFTLKAEAAYLTSSSPTADEYVLYVLQFERQSGEWVFVGGYAGEAVSQRRALFVFAPDRGMSRAFVARTAYTIGPTRSVAFEGAVRQTGDGVYAKAEYSQARGQHWRATLTAVGIAGHSDDFFGQYQHNSHIMAALRYSF